jgi:hypothetical protein
MFSCLILQGEMLITELNCRSFLEIENRIIWIFHLG